MPMTITERKAPGGWTVADVVVGDTTTTLTFNDVGLPKSARVEVEGPLSISQANLTFFWERNQSKLDDSFKTCVVLVDKSNGSHVGVLNDEDGKLKEMLDRVGWRL